MLRRRPAAVSKHEGPSSSFETRTRAPQDEAASRGNSRVPGAAQHEVVRCRPGTVPVCGGPGSAVHPSTSLRAAPRPGHAIASDAFVALFTFQTAQMFSFPRRVSAPGVLHPCFTHPESRGGRSAEKRSGAAAPVGRIMTRYARRLARRLASHDAGRSPLGAPPWRFWAPGAALPSPWAPAAIQRRAFAFRIRAASSSHPGRSAWRAGSLPPGANGYEPPAAGRHASLRLQDRLRRRPS
jgi:hypothetical protein